jgi:hypothetical protein
MMANTGEDPDACLLMLLYLQPLFKANFDMDAIIEVVKNYATLLNSVMLVVLLFKYGSDIRKHRLEYKKLECEVRSLRERENEAAQKILLATGDDIKRYVIQPMIETIRRREREQDERSHRLEQTLERSITQSLEAVHYMSKENEIHSQREQEREQHRFYEHYEHLLNKLSYLLENNTSAIKRMLIEKDIIQEDTSSEDNQP